MEREKGKMSDLEGCSGRNKEGKMVCDRKDWEIICEVLKEFQQKLEKKIEAYTSIYAEEPYPTEIQHDAVWLKDVCEHAQKLMRLQTDFIDMIKRGPPVYPQN